jgi:hypothetical protein
MTLHNYEIVDCGTFCEVIFFLYLTQESARGLFRQSRYTPSVFLNQKSHGLKIK